jgi:hypothetical protein
MTTKARDIRNETIGAKRAAVIASHTARGSTVEYRQDGKVRVELPSLSGLEAEYLVEFHGFLLEPSQPTNGVSLYKLE